MVSYQEKIEAVSRILNEYSFPLTIRQIYYRLVATNMILNKRSQYNQLSRDLVKARENGEIDDRKIEDRSRQVLAPPISYDSADDFTTSMKFLFKTLPNHYYADLWSDQEVFIEVWIEKDALSRVIQQIAGPFRVTVAPSRGYSSYTFMKREAVDERFGRIDWNKPIIILDFRDHDPSGIQMTEDLQKRFTRYGKGRSIQVRRVALTIEQVKKYELPPNYVKAEDTRSPQYVSKYGRECWELDAIEPSELQRIVQSTIREHLDEEQWDQSLRRERRDRNKLIERFKKARIAL